MNLLKEGIEQRAVVKTTLTRKLTIDGLTKAYPVYKVRLDCLFYNDQNDRIATWISQYKAQHEGKSPDSTDRENYNNNLTEKEKNHITEKDMDNYDDYDYVIENTTKEHLYKEADKIIDLESGVEYL